MFRRQISLVIALLAIVSNAFPQTSDAAADAKKKEDELRRDAVAFLREANAEVGTLRSLENRISLSSEMAGLMWLHDEKEAASMYTTVIADFKQLVTEYDSQLAVMQVTKRELEGNRRSMMNGDDSDRAKLTQKFFRAMAVRNSIALGIAEHDPSLAYDFYYDTLALVTTEELRKRVDGSDTYFEATLVRKFLEKDPAKALAVAKKSIGSGLSWSHFEMLRNIYKKDRDKGAELATAMVAKIKAADQSGERASNAYQLLSTGLANSAPDKSAGAPRPMMTQDQLRELAEMIAQQIMTRKDDDLGDIVSQTLTIAKVLPARAIQIKAKYPDRFKGIDIASAATADGPVVLRAAPLTKSTPAPEEMSEERMREIKAEKEKNEVFGSVAKLSESKLPKEERDKIVARAREIISGLGGRSEKIMALSMLAQQVALLGDKELGVEIMRDASGLINPTPRNYRDYLEMWMLVGAYAQTDPDKAFPLLEEGIYRLNDTLSAFIKVGEFMDATNEIVDDGEVQVGAFGGDLVSSLTRELGVATPTIRSLAAADFGRMKGVANRFDRPEVRILAKMLIIRSVLGKAEPDKNVKDEAEAETTAPPEGL